MSIEVIVPIYNAYEAFIRCLASLKKHNFSDRIIFINDASTDQRIDRLLTAVNNPNWTIVNNSENLGFVKTANKGLSMNAELSSVLLNSDTIVTKDWLSRMQTCLESDEEVGTITPWSNNAEICSFPITLANNIIPNDIDGLSKLLHEHHVPEYPCIPTAVGFCMLVSADAKKQVGFFDEAHFGMGYGEENDYSLRVNAAGLKNVLCDNAYVVHLGNQSFQEINLQPDVHTMARLLKKHPDYDQMIGTYIEQDPLQELRQRIIDKIRQINPALTEEIHA